MLIRQLNPSDAKSYRELRLEGLKFHPDAFGASYEEEKNKPLSLYEGRFQSDQSYTFGAFVEGELVGVVTLLLESAMKMKHRANIVAMYVTSSVRGQGIGKQLLLTALTQAKQLSTIEQVHLTVVSTNQAAKKLYESVGFQSYGIEKRALKIGDAYIDEELMVKYLIK
ncbi:GNAT family N-acetyltransferase [Metabacillus iocasae]|uniref:Ribosomal protein S18 acetylase RimI-like enzyme n=1 Tax=Priestia iocasae TaxID=2291674 RepID=A0ABS2QTS1_9BACI|nr:GNAT family N-acetyltransferase [Metabacillus iocasae]MBM7702839.1 ribosomal protein S18 acetylase RimI-like enzyme [Metabacillus iocasae]